MHLLKIRIENYRRFQEQQSLHLGERIVALVGANEAGKTSLLHSIELLGRKARIPASDVTRGVEAPVVLRGIYALDDDDRAALGSVHQGPSVAQIRVEVRSDRNPGTVTLWPEPQRDRVPRRECLDLMQDHEVEALLKRLVQDAPGAVLDPQVLAEARGALASDEESLSKATISALASIAESIEDLMSEADGESEPDPEASETGGVLAKDEAERLAGLAELLKEIVILERQPAPAQEAREILVERLPAVVWFREEDRDLQSTYKLADVANSPPHALANLCQLANLDLSAVHDSITKGRLPHVEKLIEDANVLLRERFQATWKQSAVYPRLGPPHDGTLRIFVATEGGADYSMPEERSDGLRWFMALHAFLVAEGRRNPILLVDEAETHLHYDAQADLVDVLMRQRVASQVVYTTHSVGCLPPDLGTGIRAILGDRSAERSHIVNSYWSVNPDDGDKVGYAPLLFAMGARCLALTIPRYGVVTEGPSDSVLLPTLLRQATEVPELPYRIVPGLAELAKERISVLDGHAGNVVCLVDGDEGGESLRSQLQDQGVPAVRILSLGQVRPSCQLEDLVEPTVLVETVNSEIEIWGLGTLELLGLELPSTGRWAWIEQKAREAGIDPQRLSKVRIAQGVVERSMRGDGEKRTCVAADCVEGLRVLHRKLADTLGLAKEA